MMNIIRYDAQSGAACDNQDIVGNNSTWDVHIFVVLGIVVVDSSIPHRVNVTLFRREHVDAIAFSSGHSQCNVT
jgi:hypothetical protein